MDSKLREGLQKREASAAELVLFGREAEKVNRGAAANRPLSSCESKLGRPARAGGTTVVSARPDSSALAFHRGLNGLDEFASRQFRLDEEFWQQRDTQPEIAA